MEFIMNTQSSIELAQLRVKIKSLAAEATIIRFEEEKALRRAIPHDSLHRHRVYDVACEQRAALLAYAYIRGQSYDKAENVPGWKINPSCVKPNVTRISEIVLKYGADARKYYTELADESWPYKKTKLLIVSDLKEWLAGLIQHSPHVKFEEKELEVA
jgi:hypothetical protein